MSARSDIAGRFPRSPNRSLSVGSVHDDRIAERGADRDEDVVRQDGFGTTDVHCGDFVRDDPDDLASANAPAALDSRTVRDERLSWTDAARAPELALRP